MRSTQQFSITLPNEMAERLRGRVAAGEYASESEVTREGLRALQAQDRAIERWLHDVAVPAYEALVADPARGVSLDTVRAGLDERHRSAVANAKP